MVAWIQKSKRKPKRKRYAMSRPIDPGFVRAVNPGGPPLYKNKLNRLKMAKRMHNRWGANTPHKFDSHRSVGAQGRK